MITGQTLRAARQNARMTQQELADGLGIALRTVGNWERGGAVPRKHWKQIVELLPQADRSEAPRRSTPAEPEERERMVNDLYRAVQRLRAQAASAEDPNAFVDKVLRLYEGAVKALDWAEEAVEVGVDPALIRDFTSALVAVAIDSGTVGMLARSDDVDAITTIVYRAADISARAQREAQEREPFESRILFPDVPRASSDVSDHPDDEEDFDVSTDVQKDMGLAAKRGERKVDQPHAE